MQSIDVERIKKEEEKLMDNWKRRIDDLSFKSRRRSKISTHLEKVMKSRKS